MSHEPATLEPGFKGVTADWSADKQAFPVPWGNAMMWIFLLSDTFIFTCFLTSYMNVRMSTLDTWPNPSEVFALTVSGHHIPLLLIAIGGAFFTPAIVCTVVVLPAPLSPNNTAVSPSSTSKSIPMRTGNP